MYLDHQPIIAKWARARADNLAACLHFAIVSARKPFSQVPVLMINASQEGNNALFGWKHQAYAFARDNTEAIYHACEAIAEEHETRRERAPALIRYLASLPGLNLAKGGFVAQLAYGCGGCLDTVNASRLGLPPTWFNGNTKYRMKFQRTPQTRLKLARWYSETCERLGGPAGLWNDWCAEISRRSPDKFPSANHASAWHLNCLGLA